ncbi:MAG: hypothetical protein ACI3ZD_16615 [Prevotella sp.]
MKNIPIEKIIQIYEKKGCNITATCTALGIARKTFYEWREKKKKLAEGLEAAEEAIIDFAESKLVEHINNDDVQALIFFLRTKGKKRGYVEKTETDVNLNQFEELMKSCEDDD